MGWCNVSLDEEARLRIGNVATLRMKGAANRDMIDESWSNLSLLSRDASMRDGRVAEIGKHWRRNRMDISCGYVCDL